MAEKRSLAARLDLLDLQEDLAEMAEAKFKDLNQGTRLSDETMSFFQDDDDQAGLSYYQRNVMKTVRLVKDVGGMVTMEDIVFGKIKR